MKRKIANNKKGLLALDQLVGIILSAMALLFLIIYIIAPILLYTPTNLKIAKSNAKSIKEFISFSNDYMKSISRNENCYNIIRLHNLENFQLHNSDQDDNYFYVVSKRYVYIIPMSNKGKFFKNNDIKGLYKYKYDLNKDYNLKNDITKEGFWFSTDVDFEFWTLITIGKSSSNVQLEGGVKYIAFIPFLSKYKTFDITTSTVSQELLSWFNDNKNQNVLIPYVIEDNGDYKELGMFYLALDSQGDLFVPNNGFSEVLIKKNICSSYELKNIDESNSLKKIKDYDSLINKKMIHYWRLENGEIAKTKFIWVQKSYECFKDDIKIDCDNLFKKVNTYNDFKKSVEKYFSENDKAGTMVIKYEELKESEIKEIGLNFGVFFDVLDEDLSKIEDHYDNNIFDISGWFSNSRVINKKENYASNLVQIQNGKIYSYYKTDKDGRNLYYSFDVNHLRTKEQNNNIQFFFNGNLLDYDVIEADGETKGFWQTLGNVIDLGNSDNEKLFLITIPFLYNNGTRENYDIFLSNAQVYDIREVLEK